MDFKESSLAHVYKLLEEDKFVEAVETYLHESSMKETSMAF